jgi:small subunit ribosomal protein S20
MANRDAAKKYMRVSATKRARNNEWRSTLHNLRRQFKKAVATKNTAEVQTVLKTLQKTLDGAARRRVIHANTAARTKSRLAAAARRLG